MSFNPGSSSLPPKFFEAMRLPKHLESLPPGYENAFKLDPEKEKALLRDNHVAPIRQGVCQIQDLEALRTEYEAAVKKKAMELKKQQMKEEPPEDIVKIEVDGEESIEMIGPALPPHLASKESSSSGPTSDAAPSSEVSSSSLVGPALPPQVTSTDPSPSIGPTLPPHLALSESSSSSIGPTLPSHLATASTSIGPVLPPSQEASSSIEPTLPSHLGRKALSESDSPPAKKPKVEVEAAGVPVGPVLSSAKQEEPDDYDDGAIGPTLPPEVAAKLEEHVGSANEEEESFGPSLPPSMKEEDSDEEDFGPQLPGAEGEDSYEKRFIHYKIKEDQKRKENTKREEWMLKCPTKNKSYLPFSSDSSFGKTVQSKEVDSSETLLDKHQRKLKKEEAKKKDEPQERKAFNRDEDMSMMSGGKKVDVNKLREHIGGLGSRFASSGSSSKFL